MEHYWQNIDGFFTPYHMEYYKLISNYFIKRNVHGDAQIHLVEIGSFKGRSSSFMAVEIANSGKNIRFDCVDIWKVYREHQPGETGEIKEVIEDTFEAFLNNMKPVTGFFQTVRMPSVDAAATYADNSLDWVFIDAEHDYESVKKDIIAWYPKVKIGGMIGGHDFHYQSVIDAVSELLPDATGMFGCWHERLTPEVIEKIKIQRNNN